MEHEGLPARVCNHNVPAVLRTSMTERNSARRFFCCSQREFNDCRFWEWVDPKLSPYYKNVIHRMRNENERIQERLNAQLLLENLHADRYRMKVSECEAIQRKLDKARASIEGMELEIKKKDWKMKLMFCMFAALIVAFISMM